MLIKNIHEYTRIYEASKNIQGEEESDRAMILRRIAIAGLIESGVTFNTKNGVIKADGEAIPFEEVKPYLSDYFFEKRDYNSSVSNKLIDKQPELSKEVEEDQEDTGLVIGHDGYDTDSLYVIDTTLEDTEDSIDSDDIGDVDAFYADEMEQMFQEEYKKTGEDEGINSIEEELEESISHIEDEQPEASKDNKDVDSLPKNGITYEKCNIEITDKDGNIYRFTAQSAPVHDVNDKCIISRLKLLNKDDEYLHTSYGEQVSFTFKGITIKAERENKPDGSYSCNYWSDDDVILNKINVETGGNQGNPVIYDENLELRIFPFPNVKDRNTGKMIFGNNKSGEAAFLYFIKNNDKVTVSSVSEKKPEFHFNDTDYSLTAKWNRDVILMGAHEIR